MDGRERETQSDREMQEGELARDAKRVTGEIVDFGAK